MDWVNKSTALKAVKTITVESEGGTSQQLSIFPVDSSTPHEELMSRFIFFPCVFALV